MVWLRVTGHDKGQGQVRPERGLQAASFHGEPATVVKVALCRVQARVVVGKPRAALAWVP